MKKLSNKQFGVWLDNRHATVVGMKDADGSAFEILGQMKNTESTGNSNEHAANNAERTLQARFFREIAAVMPNADEVHVTGTGTSQEQFIRFLADTPQFKNVASTETTTEKMSDEKLVEYISGQFTG